MSHAHFLLNQTCGNNLISDHSSVLAQTAGQTVPNLSLLLADYPPKRYTSWKYLLVLFPYNASGTSYSCSSLQSKRKGTSHISMTHALLCIYSFLILFQKVFHCENLWCFDIQHQKSLSPVRNTSIPSIIAVARIGESFTSLISGNSFKSSSFGV